MAVPPHLDSCTLWACARAPLFVRRPNDVVLARERVTRFRIQLGLMAAYGGWSGLVEAKMLSTSSSAGTCCPDHSSTLIWNAAAVFSCIDSLDTRIGPSTDMLNMRRQMFCARRAIAS